MHISQDTIKALGTVCKITTNVLLSGSILRVVSPNGSLYAEIAIDKNFDTEFGIYDLSTFLSCLSLIDSPTFTVNGNQGVITSSDGSTRIAYAASSKSMLKLPLDNWSIDWTHDDSVIAAFTLAPDVIKHIKRAASVLKHDVVSFENIGGVLYASVEDPEQPSANVYSTQVCEVDDFPAGKMIFDVSVFSYLDPVSYEINVTSKLARFRATESNGSLNLITSLSSLSTV